MYKLPLLLALGCGLLAACGQTTGEQAALGAAGGALVATALGEDDKDDIAKAALAGGAGTVAYCRMYPLNCQQ